MTALQGRLPNIRMMNNSRSDGVKLPIFVKLDQKSEEHGLSAKKAEVNLSVLVKLTMFNWSDGHELSAKRVMVDNMTKLIVIKISPYVKLWFSVY